MSAAASGIPDRIFGYGMCLIFYLGGSAKGSWTLSGMSRTSLLHDVIYKYLRYSKVEYVRSMYLIFRVLSNPSAYSLELERLV